MLTDAGFVEAEYAETALDRGRMTARKPVRAP
jgi:hypothetical protein